MRTTSEYDAFGPWIDEVRTVDDLPRLYRNAGIDPAACHLVLKIPRDIPRRDATPDMHLYDHLVVVERRGLTVLSRSGDAYHTGHVSFEQIVAIEDSVALLDGRLTLHTADGWALTIPYNGSGGSVIRTLVRTLRRLYLPPNSEPGPDAGAPTGPVGGPNPVLPYLGVKDIGLVSALETLVREEPQARLLNWTTRRVVRPLSGGVVRLLRSMWPMTLHASITVTDGREVQVIHRREWFTHGDEAVYSLARTVLPLARITGIQVGPHTRFAGLYHVAVHAGATCLWFSVPSEPATDALLAQLLAPAPA